MGKGYGTRYLQGVGILILLLLCAGCLDSKQQGYLDENVKGLCEQTGGSFIECPPCPTPGTCAPCPPPCQCPEWMVWDDVRGCIGEGETSINEACYSINQTQCEGNPECRLSYWSCDYIPEGKTPKEVCPHGHKGVCAPKTNREIREIRFEKDAKEKIGAPCETDDECSTPFRYAVRSSCPFSAACIDGTCVVGCAMLRSTPDPLGSKNYEMTCEVDADCDCSKWPSQELKSCSCHNNRCFAVVAATDEDILSYEGV